MFEVRADAFVRKKLNDLEPGSLYFDREQWWLRVIVQKSLTGLFLTGQYKGRQSSPEYGRDVITLTDRAGWFAKIAFPCSSQLTEDFPVGALAIGDGGPLIYAVGDKEVVHYFDLGGAQVDYSRGSGEPVFPSWSAWVDMGPNDRFKLFEVQPDSK